MHRIFFGHHKCASRFFRRGVFALIASENRWDLVTYKVAAPPYHFSHLPDLDIANLDFERIRDARPAVLNLTNSTRDTVALLSELNPDFRGLRVIRDPRQMLVSAYFHHRNGHPTQSPVGWVWDKLATDKPRLRELPIEEGILYELDNISGEVFDKQIFGWQTDPRILERRIEDINSQRTSFIEALRSHMDVPIMPVVNWGRNFSDSGARHWKEYFTPRIQRIFNERYGDKLEKIGYRHDE